MAESSSRFFIGYWIITGGGFLSGPFFCDQKILVSRRHLLSEACKLFIGLHVENLFFERII
jgi:hypothetical protein